MGFFTAIKKVISVIATEKALEQVIRFSAWRTADLVYYSIPVFRDPKIIAGSLTIRQVTKMVERKYKRVNFDPQVIFEKSIDAAMDDALKYYETGRHLFKSLTNFISSSLTSWPPVVRYFNWPVNSNTYISM